MEVLREREFVVDATVVRIMKARKNALLNDILLETNKLITIFKPQPVLIKKRIEILIEKEYLKRDETDR